MRKFHYKALDGQGELVSGQRVSQNRSTLREFLREKGLTEVDVEDKGSLSPHPIEQKKTLSRFFRNMHIFLESGLDLVDSLNQVGDRVDDESLKTCIGTITADLKSGRSFGNALKACEPYIPQMAHRICAIGEESGNLPEACSELADFFRTQYDFLNKVYSMLLYPIVVVSMAVIVLFFIFYSVLPRVAIIFERSDAQLPFLTNVLLGISDLLTGTSLYLILLGIGGLILGGYLFFSRPSGKQFLMTVLNKFSFYRRMNTQMFCLSMYLCTRVGMDITRSLQLSGAVFSDLPERDKINEAVDSVSSGHSLTESLRDTDIEFIPYDSLRAGEQSGNLQKVFQFQAELLQDEVREELNRLVNLIEPVIVVVLAVFVGLIVAGVMLPIFQVSSAVS